MTIEFFCPSGHRLTAAASEAGQLVQCPQCGHEAIVPGSTGRDPTPVPPSGVPPLDRADVPSAGPSIDTLDGLTDRVSQRQPTQSGPSQPEPSQPGPSPPDPGAVSSALRLQGADGPERRTPVRFYRADEGKIASLRWLALFLGLVATFGVLPAVRYLNLQTAPGWARAVLLVAVLQGAYIAWMAASPDWSTLAVLAIVFAITAAIYAVVGVWVLSAPGEEPLGWGLEAIRRLVPPWCGCVLTLSLLAAYLAGRAGVRWRRSAKLEMAGRSGR